MAMILWGSLNAASDQTMAAVTRQPASAFRAALMELIESVAAGIIASDPTIIEAAEQAVQDALEAGLDDRYVLKEQTWMPVTDYATQFLEEGRKVIGGIYEDGTWEFLKLENETGVDTGGGGGTESREGETVSDRARVGLIGDSLTEGFPESTGGVGDVWPDEDTIRYHLAQIDTPATIFNAGHSGQTVDEAGIRIGALPLVMQSAVTVPASGSVSVTIQEGIGWRPNRTWDFHGTLDGIPGVLRRVTTATTSMSFTPDPGATSGRSVAAGSVFVGDADQHQWDIIILGLGRNNVSYDVQGTHSSVAEHVQVGLKRIIDWLRPQRKRFLLWGTINSQGESSGSEGYQAVAAINDWCQTNYPLNYVEVRSWLVNEAIYELGITPTSGDLAAMAADRPPESVMIDSVHWSKPVAAALATKFGVALRRRDWMG